MRTRTLRVQRSLLLRARQRPRDLAAPLLAEHEAHLLRRAQPVRVVGAERRAGSVAVQRAQHVAPEEAVLAADLLDRHPWRSFTNWSQDVPEQTRCGHGRATAEPANRTLLMAFPQTGAKPARFALRATRAPRILRGIRSPCG